MASPAFDDISAAARFAAIARRRMVLRIALGAGFPFLLLVIWEACVAAGMIDARFFPAPSTTLYGIIALLENPDDRMLLLTHTAATYVRLVAGFTLGASTGIVVGAAMALSAPIRYSLAPFINATFPTPKLAIFPLLIVIFGLGEGNKIALVALGVFYMACLSTLGGVLYSNPLYRDVATAFRIPAWTRWTRVALPSAMPAIVTGLKLSLGQALILVVSAEFVSADAGLGQFIWGSWQVFDIPRMFTGLIVVALTGSLAVLLGELLERRLIPWATH